MKTKKMISEKNLPMGILKACAVFLLSTVTFIMEASAEVDLEEAQENAARNEMISYLIMGLGIAGVLFIAIQTVLKGRKEEGSGSGNSGKPVSHRPFSHKHDHHHGRRGAPIRRR